MEGVLMFDPILLAAARIADVDATATAHDKGASFEALAIYLFEHLNGVEVTEHDIRMPSEEIDIVLWNAQLEEVLRPWEAVVLVECKNWSANIWCPSFG